MGIKLASANLNARELTSTVSQGALTVAVDATTYGGNIAPQGTINVTLDVYNGKSGANYAPHVCIVTANATNFAGEELSTEYWDASAHRVEYSHDCGDINAGNWRFDQRIPIKSRNTMMSKRSVHVYKNDGRYVHTCFAYDQDGNWGSASVVIEVGQDAIQPERIIVVAQDGEFDGSPFCLTTNRVQTWAQARSRYIALGVGSPRAIYFKRGEVWETAELEGISLDNTLVDAWGQGEKPHFHILPGTGNALTHSLSDTTIKIRNLSTSGDWSSVSEGYDTGVMADYLVNWNSGMLFGTVSSAHTADILIDNCDGRNASWAYINGTASNGKLIVHECSLTDTKEYFVFAGSNGVGLVSMLGCDFHQHPDAANGGMDRWAWNEENVNAAGWYPNNGHNGIRMSNSSNSLIYACDFFGRHGWTTQMQDVYLNQSLIRINSNGETDNSGTFSNCWFEGHVIAGNVNNPNGMPPVELIIAHNIFVRDPTSSNCLHLDPVGCTVRSNLFIAPGHTAGTQIKSILNVAVSAYTPELSRNEIYSNTMIDLADDARHRGEFEPITVGMSVNYINENNIYYAPNRAAPQISDGPLDMSLMEWEPRYKGKRKSYEYWPDAHILTSDVGAGESAVIPYRADRNGTMTTAASFAGHFGKNLVRLTSGPISFSGGGNDIFPSVRFGSVDGVISVAHEAGGIRVTNNSAETWPSGAYMSAWLHRGKTAMAMDTSTATPLDSLVEGRLLAGSGATGAASGLTSVFTLDGLLRPRSGLPGAPAGTPSRGAHEVAL